MKTKSFKRVLALALATVVMLTACGQKETSTSETTSNSESKVTSESTPASESKAETEVKKEDLPVLTMYPADGNLFSGLRTGYQSDFFAEEGGFQLEVWAYSDEKSTAILTSGDLPDLMYIGSGDVETLETLIETDKIINYEDYKDQLPHFFGEECVNEYFEENYALIREKWSAGTGGLYVLPARVGLSDSIYAQIGTFDRNVVKLKWDVYEQIGAPEITDLWQLIDVAEQMLEAQPTAADGSKMYGTFLDIGMDSDRFGSMYLWNLWHGYDHSAQNRLVEVDKINGTVKSIFEEDSIYKEGVKWYNEMYRRGLMDPDSISTSRTDQSPKIGAALAMLPSGTLPGWSPDYYEVFIPGLPVYNDFTTETMSNVKNCIVINKETEHLEECLAFVDMLADPWADLNLSYGPEGDMWEIDGNVIKATDAFIKHVETVGNREGFPMSDGTEWSLLWNTAIANGKGTPIPGYVNTKGEAIAVDPLQWPEIQAITTANDGWLAWKETMDAEDLWDYCEKNNITVYQESKFQGVVVPTLADNQKLTLATIKDVVVPATWQMVYAESAEELEALWDQMVEDAMALGAQEFIDWYIENYQPNK